MVVGGDFNFRPASQITIVLYHYDGKKGDGVLTGENGSTRCGICPKKVLSIR